MIISIKEARRLMAYLPQDGIIEAILAGENTVEVNELEYKIAWQKQSEYERNQKALHECVRLNNKGTAHEKDGNMKTAIRTYKKNITNDYPAHHSFKRLMVLYRKEKDYENEERVIRRAFEVFGDYPEYVDRLKKVQLLKNKSSL